MSGQSLGEEWHLLTISCSSGKGQPMVIEWLAFFGLGRATAFVFKPILEDLAKHAAEGVAGDYIKSCFKRVFSQGHRIKIGGLGRMANSAFGGKLNLCGTSSHLFTRFVVALVVDNKYNVYVR